MSSRQENWFDRAWKKMPVKERQAIMRTGLALVTMVLLAACADGEMTASVTAGPNSEPTLPRSGEVTPVPMETLPPVGVTQMPVPKETPTPINTATATETPIATPGRPAANLDAFGGTYPDILWNKIEAGGFAEQEGALQGFWKYWQGAKSPAVFPLGPNEKLQFEYKHDPNNPEDAYVVVNVKGRGYMVDGKEVDFLGVPLVNGKPAVAAPSRYADGEIEAGQGPLLLTNNGVDEVCGRQWYLSSENYQPVRRIKDSNFVLQRTDEHGAWAYKDIDWVRQIYGSWFEGVKPNDPYNQTDREITEESILGNTVFTTVGGKSAGTFSENRTIDGKEMTVFGSYAIVPMPSGGYAFLKFIEATDQEGLKPFYTKFYYAEGGSGEKRDLESPQGLMDRIGAMTAKDLYFMYYISGLSGSGGGRYPEECVESVGMCSYDANTMLAIFEQNQAQIKEFTEIMRGNKTHQGDLVVEIPTAKVFQIE